MRRWVMVSLVVVASGCHGPKGSPDSSVKSFYAAASSEDWGGMASIASADSVAKLGSLSRTEGYLARQFKGWKNIDLNVEDWSVNDDETSGTVRFRCVATSYANYKEVKFDCSDTLTLKKESDGWHIVLPAAQKIRSM
jgi:hypothetical protein